MFGRGAVDNKGRPPVVLTVRAKMKAFAILGLIGGLLIAIPAATSGEPARVAIGTVLGVAATVLISWVVHVNRAKPAKLKRGIADFRAVFGFVAFAVILVGTSLGLVDGPAIAGFLGGLVSAYALVVGFVPRRLFPAA